jgi:hypothetical protein
VFTHPDLPAPNRPKYAIVGVIVRWRFVHLAVLMAVLAQLGRAQTGVSEASCREFVQSFYDNYWNQYSAKIHDPNFSLPGLDSVLSRNPPVLSRRLIDLIRKDEQESRKKQEVGNLDFDPFLNSQDPDGKYRVTKVDVAYGLCRAAIDRAHVSAELKQAGDSWIFVNFHYSYYSRDGKKKESPDDDLLSILTR